MTPPTPPGPPSPPGSPDTPDRSEPTGLLAAEPEFRTLAAPDEYPDTTTQPVRLRRVLRGRRVMGYLWAAVDDGAAGFVPSRPAGDEGLDTAVVWFGRLRAAKAQGLGPLQALRAWEGATEEPRAGRLDRTEFEVGSLAELEQEAGR
ncbi:MAG TPA: hypothetical protein VIL36_21410 [Acidimicrobiales bacterium]